MHRKETFDDFSIKTECFERKKRDDIVRGNDTIYHRVKAFLGEWYDLIGDHHPETGRIIVGHVVLSFSPYLAMRKTNFGGFESANNTFLG